MIERRDGKLFTRMLFSTQFRCVYFYLVGLHSFRSSSPIRFIFFFSGFFYFGIRFMKKSCEDDACAWSVNILWERCVTNGSWWNRQFVPFGFGLWNYYIYIVSTHIHTRSRTRTHAIQWTRQLSAGTTLGVRQLINKLLYFINISPLDICLLMDLLTHLQLNEFY